MTIDLDDLIRESLQAEADALAADTRTEQAWARLEAGSARRRPARASMLVLAGAAAAAAVLVAVLARPDDQAVRVTPPAGEGPSPSPSAEDPATTDGGQPPVPPPGGVVPGTDFVAVRTDGAIVRITVATGEERELATYEPTSIGQPAVQALSLDPEGLTAYFELARAEGGFDIMSVPTDGSRDPEAVVAGREPAVDPSGTRLAFIDGDNTLGVLDLETREIVQGDAWGFDLTWLVDGRLAVTQLTRTEHSPTAVATYRVSDTAILPDQVYEPPEGVSYRFPQMSAIGTLYAVNACCGDLGPTQGELVVVGGDQRFLMPRLVAGLSGGLGRHLIVTYADGTAEELFLEPDSTFGRTPLPGDGYVFATW